MIFLSFKQNSSVEQLLLLINSDDSLQPTSKTSLEGSFLYAVLEAKDGNPISLATIEYFKAFPEVVSVTYMLEKDGHLGAISDDFIVKLNDTTSVSQFQNLAEQYNCNYNGSDTVKFTVRVPKTSMCDAIQMANIFYETGLFEYTATNIYSCMAMPPYTKNFYVFSANHEKDEFSRHECGYILFEDTGNPGHFHGRFVWAEDLPEEYQIDLLPVTVTFSYTGKICGSYPIINIIKIQKQ